MKPAAIASTYGAGGRTAAWKTMPQVSSPDDVVAFITNDDQRGPYTIVPIDEILSLQSHRRSAPSYLITPRPYGLWFPGARAEELGWELFEAKLQRIIKNPRSLHLPPGADLQALITDEFRRLGQLMKGRDLAVRSYVSTSSDFKYGFAKRCQNPHARRLVDLARMPRFVWVVEILERSRRRSKPVVAQVVLDGTVHRDDNAKALMMQIKDLIVVSEPSWGNRTLQEFHLIEDMDSGRWAEGGWSGIHGSSKAAVPRSSSFLL